MSFKGPHPVTCTYCGKTLYRGAAASTRHKNAFCNRDENIAWRKDRAAKRKASA